MNVLTRKKEETVFEIGVVVSKRDGNQDFHNDGCVEILAAQFQAMGLIVERVVGIQHEFLKLGAPTKVLGKAAAELQLKKRTHIGVDLQFQLDEIDVFIRQPDGSLFSWHERLRCYQHILYDTVKTNKPAMKIKCGDKEVFWEVGESILRKLETEGIVKEVYPLHDDIARKQLLKIWALNWWDFTKQPIDDICSYFGMKIAVYFVFLGMYTRWLLFPAAFGLIVHLIDFGWLQFFVLPVFFVCLVTWAVLFFQFWKRKNSALLARWQVDQLPGAGREYKAFEMESSLFQFPSDQTKKYGSEKVKEKEAFQREEWFGRLMRYRNDFVVILSIICLQLPLELAYAHFYEVIDSDLLKFGVTVVYLLSIQYLTRISGKIAVKLVNHEASQNVEYRADSLIYKVFGLYFMQSYVGLFYHAVLHRNIMTLRRILIQRLIFSEVLENLLENTIPYLKYSFKKFRAVRIKRKCDRATVTGKLPRVEKEYLKPTYSASICEELEDGLFDDFLELALQFGMIMMFACAFPLAFTFATLNNITEIRTDALKLLVMLRRPIPRHDATIGAWLNIFQFLIVMSICTNCVLLVCLYDRKGEWNISPGLVAILLMEHVLLVIKFGFSHFVPEEPTWVRASRLKNATHAQDMCSRELLRTISFGKKSFKEVKKHE